MSARFSKAVLVAIVGCLYGSLLILSACSTRKTFAPVAEISAKKSSAAKLSFTEAQSKGAVRHVVLKGETLYAIAWHFSLDYRELARDNHIAAPYAIFPGQILSLQQEARAGSVFFNERETEREIEPEIEPEIEAEAEANKQQALSARGNDAAALGAALNSATTTTAAISTTAAASTTALRSVSRHGHALFSLEGWTLPLAKQKRRIINVTPKGIDFYGIQGEAIYAARAGKVVYAGDGLRGYGNLILIKHNELYISAYAHNKALLVKEGEMVIAGQLIATMGSSGTAKNIAAL